MSTGESTHNLFERVSGGFEECLRDADRWLHAQPVAQSGGIFNRRPLRYTTMLDGDDLVSRLQVVDKGQRIFIPQSRPQFRSGERTELPEQIMCTGRSGGLVVVRQSLQLQFDVRDHLWRQKLSKFALAEQFRQQIPIKGESCRPAFCQGCVTLIEERSDELEEKGRREWAG